MRGKARTCPAREGAQAVASPHFRGNLLSTGQLCSDNRSVMGFNLIWLTDKVEELNEELDDMLRWVGHQ